jgi:hypothetical protein
VLATAALADPPGRVGRISYLEGEVSFQPPQEDFWTSATSNFPVAQGEAFWTGDEGRAELQVGPVEARLDNETELDVVDLDYGAARLSLAQGSVDLRLWRAPRGGVVIATPAGDVRFDYAGSYRIDVGAPQDDGSYPPVEVTVFEGEAGVPSPDGPVGVDAGEAAMIDAGYAPQEVDVQDAAIDDWARDREARERWNEDNGLSGSMTGVEDLEAYGQFEDTADYGQVWFPRDVDPDWAPYREGHWAYVNPWGWTWIDDQPWGFAPFHYGRWAQIDGRWGWVPGRRDAEPIYAPALVAFIGGGGWSIGIGGGDAMGWVPLAPDEVYRPDYQVSDDYVRRLNTADVNQTVINNVDLRADRRGSADQFRNARAAVVVPADAFARGAPVQRAVVPTPVQSLAGAPIAPPTSRPAPTREARAGFAVGPGARPGVGAPFTAPPPPARLQAVRAAEVRRPVNPLAPPVIPGATLAPPRNRAGGGATTFVAPSQIHNLGAQGRQAPPVVRPATPLAPAAGAPATRAIPLRALAKPPPGGGAPSGEPRRFERPPPAAEPPTTPPTGEPRRFERPSAAKPPTAPPSGTPRRFERQPPGTESPTPPPTGAPRRFERPPPGSQPPAPATQPRGLEPRRPQDPAQPGEPARNKPTPPAKPKYRIGPDGKPIPIPQDENPRP